MGPSSNRPHTMIDMLAVVPAAAPSQASTDFRLQDLQGPSPVVSRDIRGMRSGDGIALISPESNKKSILKQDIRLGTESPWNRYDKIYDLDLDGPIEVAALRASPVELVHIRKFYKPAMEKALRRFRAIQNPNIITALNFFTVEDSLYVVLEYMPISLEEIVRSPAYPDERQLAVILGQVLNGLEYLAAEGFEHGSLACSNILLNTKGDVKIAHQECCQLKSKSGHVSYGLRALSRITMELMQKYIKEDGAVGIDDLVRWKSNSDAVSFLSATTSATSMSELLQHPLLTRTLDRGLLSGLVSLAQVCYRGRYKYTPCD